MSSIFGTQSCWLRTGALLAATLFSVNGAGAQESGSLPSSARMLIERTCAEIMVVRRGTVQSIACLESLARVLGTRSEGDSIQSAIAECQKRNLREGTGEFSTCVLDGRNASEDARASAGDVESVVVTEFKIAQPSRLNRSSYVESPPRERRRKQEYACAQLGLTPGFFAFSNCVADLAITLEAAERPNG